MNPAKAAPSAPVKQADDQQDTGHADEHHGQGGHPGRKMKHWSFLSKNVQSQSDILILRS